MGRGNKNRKGMEKLPDGAMPANLLEEVVARQNTESSSPPPPDLPVAENPAEKKKIEIEELNPDYKKELKEYLETIFLEKGALKKFLGNLGFRILSPELIRRTKESVKDSLQECINEIADSLVKKHTREGAENIILSGEFDDVEEISHEAKRIAVAYYADSVEELLERNPDDEDLKLEFDLARQKKERFGVDSYPERQIKKTESPKKAEEKIAPKRSEKETRDLIPRLVEQSVKEKQEKLIATIEEMEKMMREIGEGKKELISSKPEDKEAVGIIEHSLGVIKIDDGDYRKAFQELKNPKNYIREMKRELAEAYGNKDLEAWELKNIILSSVNGHLDKIAHRNPIVSEMLYLAGDIERGRIAIADKKEESSSFISELKEKRRKQTEEITSKNFDEIVAKDIDNMLARWSRDKDLTAEDVAEIKGKYISDKNIIINEITKSILDGIADSGMPFSKDVVELRSFVKMRDKVIEYCQRYFDFKKRKEEEEKNKFSPEQVEFLGLATQYIEEYFAEAQKIIRENEQREDFDPDDLRDLLTSFLDELGRAVYSDRKYKKVFKEGFLKRIIDHIVGEYSQKINKPK